MVGPKQQEPTKNEETRAPMFPMVTLFILFSLSFISIILPIPLITSCLHFFIGQKC